MSFDMHDKNFTAFKVYVDNYHGSLTNNITDRLFNDSIKLKLDRKIMLEAVHTWCENNDALYSTGYSVKFDKNCGCTACPCSPGYRVMVNKQKVMNSGYTQLLWLQRSRKGPKSLWIDMDGNEKTFE